MQSTTTARLLEKFEDKNTVFWVFFECVDKILGHPLRSSNVKDLKDFTFKRHGKYNEIFIASTPPKSELWVKDMYRLPSGEFCFAYDRMNYHNRNPLPHGIENGRLVVGKSIVLYAPLTRRRTFKIFRGKGDVYAPEKWKSLNSGLDIFDCTRNVLILPGEQTYIYLNPGTFAIKKSGIYSEFNDHGIVFEKPVNGYSCFDLDPSGEYVYVPSQDDVIVISTYDWKVKKVIKFPETVNGVLRIVKLKDPFRLAVSGRDGIYIFDEWVERKEVTSLLLMGREFCTTSPFHKDVFPLDIFKYVLDLSLLLRTKTSSVSEFKPFPNLK